MFRLCPPGCKIACAEKDEHAFTAELASRFETKAAGRAGDERDLLICGHFISRAGALAWRGCLQ